MLLKLRRRHGRSQDRSRLRGWVGPPGSRPVHHGIELLVERKVADIDIGLVQIDGVSRVRLGDSGKTG